MNATRTLLLFVVYLSAFSFSCGDSVPPETVNLYVFNAYAGSQSISLIGPTGTLVNGLEFGKRNEGKLPLEFNRNLGANFTLLVDGAPTPFEFSNDIFALYPHETATVVITRRRSESDAQALLFRHRQHISPVGLITFINAMSLGNTYTPYGNGYNLIAERQSQPNDLDYVPDDQGSVITECGVLQLDESVYTGAFAGLRRTAGSREPLYQAISSNNWFLPAPCVEENVKPGSICYYWGEPYSPGEPSVIAPDGSALLYKTSSEYRACLGQLLKPKKQIASGGGSGGGATGDKCPSNPNDWSAYELDAEGLRECLLPFQATVDAMSPDSSEAKTYFVHIPRGQQTPSIKFRFRTPGTDGVFGTADGGLTHQNDDSAQLVEIETRLASKNETFVMVYGRAVSPFISQWTSEGSIVDLTKRPYPNDTKPTTGDSLD